jgi:DUF971 family protein
MVVKNALPAFFQNLATSELYAEMLRVGDPTRRVSRPRQRQQQQGATRAAQRHQHPRSFGLLMLFVG